MPEEHGTAEPYKSAFRSMYILEGGFGSSSRCWSSLSCTQAAPDHLALASGPAGKLGKQSHRHPLEARLSGLVEHLSRVVHDFEPAVMLDRCMHVMLQEPFKKTGGDLQRAPLWRLIQAQLLKLLWQPLLNLQAGTLPPFVTGGTVPWRPHAAKQLHQLRLCPVQAAQGCPAPQDCLGGWASQNKCTAACHWEL